MVAELVVIWFQYNFKDNIRNLNGQKRTTFEANNNLFLQEGRIKILDNWPISGQKNWKGITHLYLNDSSRWIHQEGKVKVNKASSDIGCLLLWCSFVKSVPVAMAPIQLHKNFPNNKRLYLTWSLWKLICYVNVENHFSHLDRQTQGKTQRRTDKVNLSTHEKTITQFAQRHIQNKNLFLTSLDFNYVKPCLDLMKLKLQLLLTLWLEVLMI